MYHIVVNPASKSGKGKKKWLEEVQPYFKSNHIAYEAYMSCGQGDIKIIAKQLCEKTDERPIHVIVLGGDGTLNEFIQGIETPEDFIIGYIPTGSSNDFARALGIPSDTKSALDIICNLGHSTIIDLGRITFSDGQQRLFTVSCGIGFDAAVCEIVNKSTTKNKLNQLGLGKLSYLSIAVKNIFTAKRVSGTLSFDGKNIPIKKLLFLSGQNERFEGGGFLFAPEAKDNDNYIDICLAHKLTIPEILIALPFALFGKHTMFRGIHTYRTKTFTITVDQPLWVHTDGEVYREDSSLTVECLPSYIHVIKP